MAGPAISDKKLLERMSFFLEHTPWPVENKNGRVKLAERNEDGQTLAEFMALRLKISPADDLQRGVKLFNAYIETLNDQTKVLASSTHVTSTPEIAMVIRPGNAYPNVMQNLLKNQLEASGAKVTVLDSRDRFVRDHYVLDASGIAIPLAVTALNSSLKDNSADARNSSIVNTINALNKAGVQSADIAGGSLAYGANKFLAKYTKLTTPFDPRGDERIIGGDVLQHPQSNTVFVGINLDDSGKPNAEQLKAAQALSESLHMKLVPVPKAQQKPFYHLDTFMSVLPDGSVVLLPDATTAEARDRIKQATQGHDMLELPVKPGEAQSVANTRRNFATNIITVNGNSFTANALPELKEFLKAHNLNAVEGPFLWGNSGPHCQVNFIKRGKVDGRSDVAETEPNEATTRFAYQDIPQTPEQFSPSVGKGSGNSQQTQLG